MLGRVRQGVGDDLGCAFHEYDVCLRELVQGGCCQINSACLLIEYIGRVKCPRQYCSVVSEMVYSSALTTVAARSDRRCRAAVTVGSVASHRRGGASERLTGGAVGGRWSSYSGVPN